MRFPLRACCWINWLDVITINFAYLVWTSRGEFSCEDVQFQKTWSSVKTSCPLGENVNETSEPYTGRFSPLSRLQYKCASPHFTFSHKPLGVLGQIWNISPHALSIKSKSLPSVVQSYFVFLLTRKLIYFTEMGRWSSGGFSCDQGSWRPCFLCRRRCER